MDIQSPPAIYTTCKPATLEIELPLNRLNVVCRQLGVKLEGVIAGCSIWGYGGMLVVVPRVGVGVTQNDQNRVREHEEAHGCGWPSAHPQ